MHKEIERLVQTSQINWGGMDISEFELLSRTPITMRNEFACHIDLIQHKSRVFGQLKLEEMYIIIGEYPKRPHRCVMGAYLVEFQVDFPELSFPKIHERSMEGIMNRVEAFEKRYLKAYYVGRACINAYKKDLDHCQSLSEVSVVVIEYLYLQCAQKIAECNELMKTATTNAERKSYMNLLILEYYYLGKLKDEATVRAKRNGLHTKGP